MKGTVVLFAAMTLPFFSATNINFDSMKLGELPPGWVPTQHWVVKTDPTAPSRPNVLARLSKGGLGAGYPICFLDNLQALDGDVSVKMKILSGRDGQDAGVVFRAIDPNNYYLVRASTRDHNIAMFRVQDGHFEPVRINGGGRGNSFNVVRPIKVGDWNLLRVTYKGNQASVYFNHRKVFDVNDTSVHAAGRAGVWTNADTVAYFDDFRIDKKR